MLAPPGENHIHFLAEAQARGLFFHQQHAPSTRACINTGIIAETAVHKQRFVRAFN
jgi:hypothetical protein